MIWRSKKQNVVARNSVEAEFRAVSQRICEGPWLKKFLEEIQVTVKFPIKFNCDNKSTINISFNPVQHDQTKNIDVDMHFIKEKVEDGTIYITYIRTKEQIEYAFTKGLYRHNFDNFISKLDVINIYYPA